LLRQFVGLNVVLGGLTLHLGLLSSVPIAHFWVGVEPFLPPFKPFSQVLRFWTPLVWLVASPFDDR